MLLHLTVAMLKAAEPCLTQKLNLRSASVPLTGKTTMAPIPGGLAIHRSGSGV